MRHRVAPCKYQGAWAPGVIHEGGTWSLFFTSTNASTFPAVLTECVGVATATSPFGPFTKYPEPVLCGTKGTAARKVLDNARPWIIRGDRVLKMRVSTMDDALERPDLWMPTRPAPPADNPWLPPFLPNTSEQPFTEHYEGAQHFENCEVFAGPAAGDGDRLHMTCFDNRGCQEDGRCNPHFVLDPASSRFEYVGHANMSGTAKPCRIGYPFNEGTFHHCEPAPAYEGGQPGDEATVRYMVSFW